MRCNVDALYCAPWLQWKSTTYAIEGYIIAQLAEKHSPSTVANMVAIPSRVFTSQEEIKSEPGFKPDAPVKQSTYSHMLGVYEFSDLIIKCCYERSPTHICQRCHGYGVVTVDKDGVVSVIGNCCARKYFDVDTNLRRDMAKALNERGRLKRLESVRKLIAEKDVRISKLEELKSRADSAAEVFERFVEPLGESIRNELREMLREESTNISVVSVHKKVGLDENGDEITETDRFDRQIGTVRGLGAFDEARTERLKRIHRVLVSSFQKLSSIGVEDDIRSSELKTIQSVLKTYDGIVSDYQDLIKDLGKFTANDLKSFLFLTQSMSEKKILAKHILAEHNLPNGNDRAKEFIKGFTVELARQYKADKIEIPPWR